MSISEMSVRPQLTVSTANLTFDQRAKFSNISKIRGPFAAAVFESVDNIFCVLTSCLRQCLHPKQSTFNI